MSETPINKAIMGSDGELHSAMIIDTTSPSEYWGTLAEPIDFWTIPNFLKDEQTFNTFIQNNPQIIGEFPSDFIGTDCYNYPVVCRWLNRVIIILLLKDGDGHLDFNRGNFYYGQFTIDENNILLTNKNGSYISISAYLGHNSGNNIPYFCYSLYFCYGRILVEGSYVYGYYAQINDRVALRKDGTYFTGILNKIPFPLYNESINAHSGLMDLGGGSSQYGGLIPIEQWTTETIAPSGTGGGYGAGGGNYDITSDPIPFAPLPTLSAINTGLLNLYKPTVNALQSLGGYLWSTSFLDNIEKLWQDPMDLIVSLNILPITPVTENSRSIKIGSIDTDIPAQVIGTQFHKFNCGSLEIDEYFGNALDYSPYTKIQLFLPYVSTIDLDTDDVMSATISIEYNIDVFSGEFFVMVKSNKGNLNSVLYSYTGNMASNLPISAKNYSNVLKSLTMGAVGLASGSSAVSAVASGVATATLGAKPSIQRAGNMSNSGSYVGIRTPYLIISRPIQSLPKNYSMYNGYPSNITAYLNTLTGFTKVDKIISNNLDCTDEEQDEIISLLKEGVII